MTNNLGTFYSVGYYGIGKMLRRGGSRLILVIFISWLSSSRAVVSRLADIIGILGGMFGAVADCVVWVILY